jgi:hypothetical protein
MRAAISVVMLLLVVGAAGCSSNDPLVVNTIQLGRSLNSDDTVGNHATTFKPTDTVYLSAINDAVGSGTIAVRWVYAGQTVSQESKDVRFTRDSATSFRLQPPSAGFPEGDYRVEIEVNGQNVGTRTFRVTR